MLYTNAWKTGIRMGILLIIISGIIYPLGINSLEKYFQNNQQTLNQKKEKKDDANAELAAYAVYYSKVSFIVAIIFLIAGIIRLFLDKRIEKSIPKVYFEGLDEFRKIRGILEGKNS